MVGYRKEPPWAERAYKERCFLRVMEPVIVKAAETTEKANRRGNDDDGSGKKGVAEAKFPFVDNVDVCVVVFEVIGVVIAKGYLTA